MSPAARVPIVGPRWLPSPGPVGLKASDAGSRPRLVFAWGQRSALSSHGSLFSCLARTRAAWGVFSWWCIVIRTGSPVWRVSLVPGHAR